MAFLTMRARGVSRPGRRADISHISLALTVVFALNFFVIGCASTDRLPPFPLAMASRSASIYQTLGTTPTQTPLLGTKRTLTNPPLPNLETRPSTADYAASTSGSGLRLRSRHAGSLG
jgi:hypothetical protein